MAVSFPTIIDPQMVKQKNGDYVNAHAADNRFWLDCLLQILRERQGPPMVLEVIGPYSEWRLGREVLREDDEWDGIPYNASFVDRSWRLVGEKVVKKMSELMKGTIVDIVRVLATWARSYAIDDPILAPYRGQVYITTRRFGPDDACSACRLRYASLRPFNRAARLPEWAIIPYEEPKLAVYGQRQYRETAQAEIEYMI
jgi:hypothetical protein